VKLGLVDVLLPPKSHILKSVSGGTITEIGSGLLALIVTLLVVIVETVVEG
jgi:hypothetical protein